MGQMAQFSTLEQTTNIATANEQMATTMGISQALGLLGKTVTYVDDAKVSHTGVVQKVVTEGGTGSPGPSTALRASRPRASPEFSTT